MRCYLVDVVTGKRCRNVAHEVFYIVDQAGNGIVGRNVPVCPAHHAALVVAEAAKRCGVGRP